MHALPVHPAADLFPMMSDEELRDLAANIAANKMLHPIVVWDDPDRGRVLLDGRNRLAACKIAGVEPDVVEFEGDDPVGFVISSNIHRRHLTPAERAVLALALEPHFAEQAAKRKAHGQTAPGREAQTLGAGLPQAFDRAPKARDQAAAATGASGRVVAQAKRVATEAPDLMEKVKAGEMSLHAAEKEVIARKRGNKPAAREPRPAKHLRGSKPVDPNDLVDNVVMSLHGLDSIIDDCLTMIADLEPERAAKWAGSIAASVTKINKLKKELQAHAGDQ